MPAKLTLLCADITGLEVDAIVNAANSALLGGGGVDGAIHRAAGPDLLQECRMLNGCKVGKAKITKGYRLKARHVIHTVGPVWHGGAQKEAELLADCYRNSLQLAVDNGLTSVAFPCISTGVYRYPLEKAATVAVTTVKAFVAETDRISEVIFCCFSEKDLACYTQLLESRCGPSPIDEYQPCLPRTI